MTIKIEESQIDKFIDMYLNTNNMRYVGTNEPTHELCEFFASKNKPVIVFDGELISLLIYTHHVEVTNITNGDYEIDVYIRR